MKIFLNLLIITIIVEKIVEVIKDIFGKKIKPPILRLISIIVAAVVIIITQIGLLSILNLLPDTAGNVSLIFDYLITAILVSKGSNVMHDLLSLIQKLNDILDLKKK
jgi:hypothetical protein